MLKDRLRKGVRVYGPYTRKDGRKHVIVWWKKGKQRTISYPKWLTEQRLGKELADSDTVDHHDRDVDNNSRRNLKVLTRREHGKLDARRAVPIDMKCVWCRKRVHALRRGVNRLSRQGKAGPFCSKSCAGSYGASVQNGGKRYHARRVKLKYELPSKR